MDAETRTEIEALEREHEALRRQVAALTRERRAGGRRTPRPLPSLVALLVLALTLACAGRAYAVAQVANVSVIQWSLASLALSAAISLPVINEGVLVIGITTTDGRMGVGQMTIYRGVASTGTPFMVWTGLHSWINPAVTGNLAWGFVGGDADAVYIDADHQVLIRAYGDSLRVVNGANSARAGNVKLIW
jgi:hypothetical protein